MKVIGLTGGIGSGKSTASELLSQLGAKVLDADKVGHQCYQPDTEAWQDVVAAFGEEIVAPDRSIDRKKLGAIVFGDPDSLARLNGIMHPRMKEMMADMIEQYRQDGVEVVVLDAAILLEANWTHLVDAIWITVASESTVIKRVKERTGLPEEQIRSRIRSQMTIEERTERADLVINNDGSLDELKVKVEELWEGLRV